jgi:hypothetical protein
MCVPYVHSSIQMQVFKWLMIILHILVTYTAAGTWNCSAYELEPICLVTSSIGFIILNGHINGCCCMRNMYRKYHDIPALQISISNSSSAWNLVRTLCDFVIKQTTITMLSWHIYFLFPYILNVSNCIFLHRRLYNA